MNKSKVFSAVALAGAAGLVLVGCSTDADVASRNLSQAADNFEIDRKVVFYNGITDEYLLVIEGKCSLDPKDKQLQVTCKLPDGQYKKHFLGLSDNVTYVAEQLEGAEASDSQYRVIFKPSTVMPDIDVR